MDKKELEQAYAKLLREDLFDQLSLRLAEPNIFRILGIENYEIRHSNFLAWLLDPNETHGLGDYFLNRFLQDILLDERARDVTVFEVASIDNKHVSVHREWKNIDILILTEQLVICIENKVHSGEHSGQLKKYHDSVIEEFQNRKPVFVYLSPYGNESSMNNAYINYGYDRIIIILKGLLAARKDLISESVVRYIDDYLISLNQNLMNEDTANHWAKELYKNHKSLFDFVFENKPDVYDDFAKILRAKCTERGWKIGSKNKGYVRFYTPALEGLILRYKRANGWPDKEGFLFEFDFYNAKRIVFRSVVTPPVDYDAYNDRMVEILNGLEGANKNLGAMWKCHVIESKTWNLEDKMNNWGIENEKQLDKYLDHFGMLVQKVETKLLEHKDEIINLVKGIDNQ